jgi:molybdopterin-guanine dinucleotide biosynthesis protein A
MERPPAVVLAGGLGRRMGGDKALSPFLGTTLLHAVLARLAPQAGALAISANDDPARFAAFGLPVLPDPLPGRLGPLAGVLAAMDWAAATGATAVLTVPCDAPLLPLDLAMRLTGAGAPAIAASGGRPHPVAALWPTGAASALRAALDRGERRVMAFAASLDARLVSFPVPDGAPDPFLACNTPTDLRLAETLARRAAEACPTVPQAPHSAP